MNQSRFSESDLTPNPSTMSNIDSLIEQAKRNGYTMAVNDLYQILKSKKDVLSWEELDLVTAMMEREVYTFMPKNGNAYDNLDQFLSDSGK